MHIFIHRPSTGSYQNNHPANPNTNTQLALIANQTQNDAFIQNIRIIEPALHQLEINLNHINNALRDRNNLNFNILNHALGVALAALASPRFESNLENTINEQPDEQVRLNTVRIQDLMIQEPQDEFADIVHEYQENDRMQINELNNNDNQLELDNLSNNNNNYIVEELDDDNFFNNEVNDDDDVNFIDSGDEDLIDDGTEDEEEFNQGLISLSDLHILDLEGISFNI